MKKIIINEEILKNLIPSDEELINIITAEEIISRLKENITKDYLLVNVNLNLSFNTEVLYNGIYRNFTIYIDCYNDIKKYYDNKTDKYKKYEINPYFININIYHNNDNIYHHSTPFKMFENEQIRNYRIIEEQITV